MMTLINPAILPPSFFTWHITALLSRPKVVFLSGPMSGLPDFNRTAFNSEAQRLRDAGYVVWNPAELPSGLPWGFYMVINIAVLILGVAFVRPIEVVAQLAQWDKSPGAKIEKAVASELKIPTMPSREL